ncbi:transglutaminase family protein [Tautonia marina]|uniref:transglutaminase family protein n=1 Tax=Tautonia marina TaxID=2653855 RepID=UPI0012612878|nr:transglutaminase family protein [Tautonia marina]
MLLRINHETRLTYSEPVSETIFEVRMAPQSDEDQTVLGYRLRISPRGPVTTFRDGFGNRVDLFNLTAPYRELVLHATSYVRTHRRLGVAGLAGVPWLGRGPLPPEAMEYLLPSRQVAHTPEVDAFVRGLPEPQGTLADVTRMVMEAVDRRMAYQQKATTALTSVEEALLLGRGVCQDFAHLYIAACRGLGLPARYVSGYVHQTGEMATHAWCQVWAGEPSGWVDVDPTHGVYPEDDHVVTAIGRDYADVPPNRGIFRGQAEESIHVMVTVEPVQRIPPQWQEWGTPLPLNDGANVATSGEGSARSAPRRGKTLGLGHRPDMPPGLRQQQGQQQQQSQSLEA